MMKVVSRNFNDGAVSFVSQESQCFPRQCRAIVVLPLLYASNFLYHLILAVGNPACVFLQLLVKVKRNYRSRPNLEKIARQCFQDEAPATYNNQVTIKG